LSPNYRFWHEGRGFAVAACDVFDDVLVPHERIRHVDQRQAEQVDLGLAGGCYLVVLLLDANADLFHRSHHLGADVVQAVLRRYREVAFFVTRLVPEILQAIVAGVPPAFDGVDFVERLVLLLIEADAVEDEELGLGAEDRIVADSRRAQEVDRLFRDSSWVSRVTLQGEGFAYVADQRERRCFVEWIDHGSGRIGHDQHVGFVGCLPAANRRAVKTQSLFE